MKQKFSTPTITRSVVVLTALIVSSFFYSRAIEANVCYAICAKLKTCTVMVYKDSKKKGTLTPKYKRWWKKNQSKIEKKCLKPCSKHKNRTLACYKRSNKIKKANNSCVYFYKCMAPYVKKLMK